LTFPLFVHYGVALWVPEVGGPLDPDNEAHDLVMSVFGGMSKGERNRIKVRVRTAMATQTKLEGRYLGGRPPYGYMLCDLGPPIPVRRPTANVYTDWRRTVTPPRSCAGSSTSSSRARVCT
jgi:DNA invertase Pin-like site-specific DNA recombinase